MTRGVFLALAAALCLAPPSASARAAKPTSTSAFPSIFTHPTGEVTVPFEYFRQHIYVTVSLQGKPGFIFMLDSGASKDILNLRTSQRLGMKPGSMQPKGHIGFGDERIYVAPEENVNVELDHVPVAQAMSVMDLNKFERHFSHPTDGMLGGSFFRHFVVKLDFEKKLLSILPADTYSYRGLGIKIPLAPSQNFIVIPVTVGSRRYNNHVVDVSVDTGSNDTLLLYEKFVGRLDLKSSLLHAVPSQAFGLNGYYPVKRGIVDSLQIGDAKARNLTVDYLDESEDIGPEQNIPGAIGNGILQSFPVVIFDLPHRRMIFEPKPPPWQPGVTRTTTAEP
jgi:predicted aspartyl protease